MEIKRKAGRPSGSVNFTRVTMEQLNNVFKGPARIPVPTKWAEEMGVAGGVPVLDSDDAVQTEENTAGSEIGLNIVDLDNEGGQ